LAWRRVLEGGTNEEKGGKERTEFIMSLRGSLGLPCPASILYITAEKRVAGYGKKEQRGKRN
jgi:hypothetical protein